MLASFPDPTIYAFDAGVFLTDILDTFNSHPKESASQLTLISDLYHTQGFSPNF